MNDAKLELDKGNLTGAVEHALNLVKTNPTNTAARTFLFELSCFSGDWERAEKQLEVIGHQDMNAMIGSKIFQQNLKAERDRLKYFSDGVKPETLTGSPAHMPDLLQANNRLREGDIADARRLCDAVDDARPAYKCTVNGEGFSDFRDYNDLTMCVFEVIFKDAYIWVPFEFIEKVSFQKPKSLRDLFWIQAEVELTNGTNGEMFFPALYAGSWKSENDQVRLGRMTDWRDLGNELFVGEGMKLFWMDGKDRSILDMETIEFAHPETEDTGTAEAAPETAEEAGA
jgi:type VI secretion system protein ImpE